MRPLKDITILFTNAPSDSRKTLEDIVQKHSGNIAKIIGNACICVFQSSLNACYAAQQFRQKIPDSRIAIIRDTMEIKPTGAFSLNANLAPQINGMAKSGDIYISESVFHEIKGMFACQKLGSFNFQGALEAITIYSLKNSNQNEKTKDPLEETLPLLKEKSCPRELSALTLVIDEQGKKREKIKRTIWTSIFLSVLLAGLILPILWFSKRTTSEFKTFDLNENSQPYNEPSKVQTGSLYVETLPAKATVYINNVRIKALTPVRIKKLKTKDPIRILVQKNGFENAIQLINLDSSEETKILIKLKKNN